MRVAKIKRYFTFHRILVFIVSSIFLLIIASNVIIVTVSSKYIYNEIERVPPVKAALVLGTSSKMRGGLPNPFFHNRMRAASELYHAGKVKYLILSGDNRTRYYNEPEKMRTELLKYGVPDSVMYHDYAGLRTLDSVIRCYVIFGQQSFIVVSQKFHNQRAVFLARAHGIKAIGYNAADVDPQSGVRTNTREYFARVKAIIDLITRKGPRHLGEPVDVGDQKYPI